MEPTNRSHPIWNDMERHHRCEWGMGFNIIESHIPYRYLMVWRDIIDVESEKTLFNDIQ